MLDRVHTARILHIHEVDDVKRAILRNPVQSLVFLVMVVQFCSQCRELIVVDYHRKTLGRMLLDERLDDGECLTRSRRTDYPCASEGIDDVHPALTELPLIVVSHGDVH